jgi:hypothetical protein
VLVEAAALAAAAWAPSLDTAHLLAEVAGAAPARLGHEASAEIKLPLPMSDDHSSVCSSDEGGEEEDGAAFSDKPEVRQLAWSFCAVELLDVGTCHRGFVKRRIVKAKWRLGRQFGLHPLGRCRIVHRRFSADDLSTGSLQLCKPATNTQVRIGAAVIRRGLWLAAAAAFGIGGE